MKNLLILLLSLILISSLAACGLAEEAEGEQVEPLDPAKWPTSQAAVVAASPTPFPRAIQPVEPSPTAGEPEAETPAATTEPEPVTPEAASAPAEASVNSSAGVTAALVNQALSQFSVVATGLTIAPEMAIRQGPGANYGTVTAIKPGSVFGILGKNAAGDWLYVVDASLSPGWLPTAGLRVVGSLEKAPILPPNPLAALIQSAAAASSSESAEAAVEPAPPASPPVLTTNLTPVTTAKVNNDGLNLRQGPGASYERIVTLARDDEVTILALNPRKDWALLETAAKQRGWASLTFLAAAGSVANAPIVPAAALAQASVVSQTTTTGAVSAQPAAVNTTAGSNEPALGPALVSNETANPAATFGNLGPVATVRIVRVPVDVRPGPGIDYASIDELSQIDESIPALAVDKSGQWVLVNPASTQPGWVALNDLKLEGSLADAPQVNTAWVESNGVEVRSGPGIYDDAVGVLAINTLVSVLGVDDSKSWALVKAIPAGGLGWTPINFLNLAGRWSDIPPAPDLSIPADSAVTGQVAAAAPFVPVRPVSESKIVFQRSSGGDIMVINPDGSGLQRLTSGIDPVLSPDGQKVAFTRWEGETGSLWVINTNGADEHAVLGFIKQAKGPDWSPDASQIVLNFQNGGQTDSKTDCFDIGEGQQPRPPRNATNIRVTNNSQGPQLCWKLPPDPHWGLRVIKLADASFKDVDGGTYAFRPAWDPGQNWRIISDGGRGLLEVDVNRDFRQSITDEINDSSPVFSPDGRFLAVTLGQQGSGSGWNIYRLNANGTGRIQLTETPLWETALPGNDKAWNNVAPAWSPDGSQIAFVTDRTGQWEIWVMNADGSNQHPLFSDEINAQLEITYNFVDERVLSWR
jgi:uncharacterized protein YgiM (DUF1202 family)